MSPASQASLFAEPRRRGRPPSASSGADLDLSLRYNLLVDPVVTIEAADGVRQVSLPELYARLMADQVVAYPRLRAHHVWPWHMLLVQLAYHATEGGDVPADAAGWREALRELTRAWPRDEPWHLLAPLDAPGFLQPPVPEGTLDIFKDRETAPDDIDTLVLSRNHDLKVRRMTLASPEDWLFALVNVQTMGGFEGRDVHGIMRMNGGYGSRPFMGVRPAAGGPGAHLRRDLDVLRRRRQALLDGAPGFSARGIRLLWLEPWDGSDGLSIGELHPLVIEICRRMRLAHHDGRLVCFRKATKSPRVTGKDLKGVTGDPWAPVLTGKESKSLTISEDGFGWRRVRELLFEEGTRDQVWKRPLLGLVHREDAPPLEVVFSALARGQGKTEGYHERRLAVPSKAAAEGLWEEGEAHERAALLSKRFAANAGDAAKYLRNALLAAMQRMPDKISFDNAASANAVEEWSKVFDGHVDREFFPFLWRAIEEAADPEVNWDPWLRFLCDTSLSVFDRAIESLPLAESRRLVLTLRARDFLANTLKKHLPVEKGVANGE